MRIAVVAPPFLNIPPTKQGGTEVIVSATINEFVRLGHKVTLFHAGEANLENVRKVQIFPTAINHLPSDLAAQESSRKLRLEMTYFALVGTELINREGDFDVIFNHTRGEVAFAPLTNFLKTPILSTFHLPVLPENIEVLKSNPTAYAISISNHQRGEWKDLSNFVATVHNGVELDKYPMLEHPRRDFLFWIGTVGEHKNPLDAILAAKEAKIPLIMAGKIRDQDYYEKHIKPHIDNKKVKYLGEISYEEKLPYFQNARALLFPTLWPEPFGLVAIEALACGTPVIAYPNGALPEIITDSEVGFLVNSSSTMFKAITMIDQISRNNCRTRVEEHFSSIIMSQNYLSAAEKVIRRKRPKRVNFFGKFR